MQKQYCYLLCNYVDKTRIHVYLQVNGDTDTQRHIIKCKMCEWVYVVIPAHMAQRGFSGTCP